MKRQSVKIDVKGNVILPEFKSRREESEWFDANSDFFMERLKKYGKVVGPLNVIKSEPATQAISIRVAIDDIEKAKVIAKKKGIGYQTVLKQAIRDGLKKVG